MRILITIFLFSLFFSCRSRKELNTISDNYTVETIKDTVIVIAEKHDTFYVYLPQIINSDSVIVKNKNTSLQIKKKTGSNLMIICQEDELKLKLDSVIRLKKTVYKERIIVNVDKCTNKFHIFSNYFALIAISILILVALIKR